MMNIEDIIEAVAEGYSHTEDEDPWEATDEAKTLIMEELENERRH